VTAMTFMLQMLFFNLSIRERISKNCLQHWTNKKYAGNQHLIMLF